MLVDLVIWCSSGRGGSNCSCMHDFFHDGRCHQFQVDNEGVIDRKRVMLSILLQGDSGGDGNGGITATLHVEEMVATTMEYICNPSVLNKGTYIHHIDFSQFSRTNSKGNIHRTSE